MTAYSARRLPKHTGQAGWNAILPPPPASRVLEADQTADLVIIGGGFAGLSAARRFCQLNPDAKIVLLEAGRFAESAAGRNSGFMIDLPHDLASANYAGASQADKATIRLNRMAIDFGRDAAREYGIPEEYFDPRGKINAAATRAGDRHNRNYRAHLTSMGEPCELLDRAAMLAHTGSPHYTSGLHTPGTVLLQPAGYIRALAAGLADQASLFELSPVTGFERQSEGWRVCTDRAVVSCGRIILANNGHVESFGFYRHRLMHIFLYASLSAPMTSEQQATLGGVKRWGVTPADPVGTSVRRVSGSYGDRILIRNSGTYNPSMETSARRLRNAARVHDRKFRERFPHLPGLRMEHRWAGHLCLSRNNVPAFGEVEQGVISACCQNGLGTAKGTLSGMGAAELASGVVSEIATFLSANPAPQRLPPEPFATLGATAYLTWKEWRAGRE